MADGDSQREASDEGRRCFPDVLDPLPPIGAVDGRSGRFRLFHVRPQCENGCAGLPLARPRQDEPELREKSGLRLARKTPQREPTSGQTSMGTNRLPIEAGVSPPPALA